MEVTRFPQGFHGNPSETEVSRFHSLRMRKPETLTRAEHDQAVTTYLRIMADERRPSLALTYMAEKAFRESFSACKDLLTEEEVILSLIYIEKRWMKPEDRRRPPTMEQIRKARDTLERLIHGGAVIQTPPLCLLHLRGCDPFGYLLILKTETMMKNKNTTSEMRFDISDDLISDEDSIIDAEKKLHYYLSKLSGGEDNMDPWSYKLTINLPKYAWETIQKSLKQYSEFLIKEDKKINDDELSSKLLLRLEASQILEDIFKTTLSEIDSQKLIEDKPKLVSVSHENGNVILYKP